VVFINHDFPNSIDFVDNADSATILTAGKDGPVRMWALQGRYIGTFGQDEIWDIHDQDTYASYPKDITKDGHKEASEMDEDRTRMMQILNRRIASESRHAV
jgi:hypothetical protein